MSLTKLKASRNPIEDINRITYEGQDPKRRMYKEGYEDYMDQLPVLDPDDPLVEEKSKITRNVTIALANKLKRDKWIEQDVPGPQGFDRTILAIASPTIDSEGKLKEGPEFVLARWGDKHSSPVHGHTSGYIHEEILYGKMRVNTYRIIDKENRIVRLLETTIVKSGTFASLYSHPSKSSISRDVLVHNFTSIGNSATLHYLSEHTRDGRDNKFNVQYFDCEFGMNVNDVEQITTLQGMYLQKGDVVLVRSSNVPEYGDHYIVVTGPPVMKDHGFRVQDIAIHAPDGSYLLDLFEPQLGVTLLKLKKEAKQAFHSFHGITIEGGEVVFSKQTTI